MTPNAEKLRDLKVDLDQLERVHAEILSKEPTIARPVHEAASEAKRKYNQVTEKGPEA